MPEVDVSTSVIIAAPCGVVAGFAADPDNVPRWYVNIQSVEWETPPPAVIGSRIAFVAHFLGKRLAYTYEIAEWIPERHFVMRTSEGPFPMETSYTWESLGDSSTRMTLRNRGRPTGFSVLFAPFLSLMIRRATSKDLARLKALLESNPPVSNT
jgi:uncharacterized membrane protein